ncbi:uncharacterized protein SPSK_04356 [Sporothrix schenckii 1099-18]|uniref:Uncharacterized protein n=1 Tax=Sporothrix schenckii 1099-18 TaxID=1397361 RepID=A0A0F2M5V2_SPOSC|nr:uncharacterized protein SPSK_04356 [Sporothrix schenckii 1099-18]KJR83561.1 hypothetical protein SPSK_04356 [Sporothrix schenckii 1099-18]
MASPAAQRAPQLYSPNLFFAAAQPVTPVKNQENANVFVDHPTGPAPLPRLATRHSTSFTNHRPNKPKPLALKTTHLQPHPDDDNGDGGHVDGHRVRHDDQPHQLPSQSAALRRKPVSSASTGAIPIAVSVTPVGSDREYDGGGSSYSTSPLGSEAHARIRTRMRMPFVPRTPKHVCTLAAANVGGDRATAITATMATSATTGVSMTTDSYTETYTGPYTDTCVASSGPENSLEQFLQDHIHSIERNYSDDTPNTKGRLLSSSSDEWYTTSETDPIRSRHRHRVVETQVADYESTSGGEGGGGGECGGGGSVGICNCGMQQCCQCGLFISRPRTHKCMSTGETVLPSTGR